MPKFKNYKNYTLTDNDIIQILKRLTHSLMGICLCDMKGECDECQIDDLIKKLKAVKKASKK